MCYCGAQEPFENCCAPIIGGELKAHSAEQLMRSRYSAYCVKNSDYIYQTYANNSKVNNSKREIAIFADFAEFINLRVYDHVGLDDTATVHFKADYLCDGFYCQLEEVSNFIIEEDEWRYIDGQITPHPEVKVGRNDTCPCGSGKKFKKCHG